MKNLPIEECEARKRAAFKAKGIDYDEYCRSAEQRKAEINLKKQMNIEHNRYHRNHEDDIQFGCCPPDVLAF